MEKVTGTEPKIEVFENDIDLYLHMFQEEQNIEDLRTVPQSVWNGCLKYIYRNVFKPHPEVLKQHNNYNMSNNNIPTNCNMYNYNIVSDIADYYIYLCQIYNKEISIIGFSNLTGIDNETINVWGNDSNKLSSLAFGIYKKLCTMREESLSNKLADGKQNPVGVIAMLNRHYGWASPYTSDSNKQRQSLSASELPKLGQNGANINGIPQIDN
jgi:hypothetical protein